MVEEVISGRSSLVLRRIELSQQFGKGVEKRKYIGNISDIPMERSQLGIPS